MVCLFCNSDESQICHIYQSEEDRKGCPDSERCCFECWTESVIAHLPEENECKSNENCIGWFSIEHHLAFCRERMKGLNLFLPKLDKDVLPRFLETFDLDVKYSIILSSPAALNLLPLKKIKIADTFNNGDTFRKSNTVLLNGSMTFWETNLNKEKELFDLITSKTSLFCFPRQLIIRKCQLSPEMVLLLLSKYTKKFDFEDSSCDPNLSFSDIIKKAPNLEEILIYNGETNIIYENTWVVDLLKFKIGKNLAYLFIKLDTLELDVDNIVEFIKTKCCNDIQIEIELFRDLHEITFNEIAKKLSENLGKKTRSCKVPGLLIRNGPSGKKLKFSLEKTESEQPKTDVETQIMANRSSAAKRKHE